MWQTNHPTDGSTENFVQMGLMWWEWNNVASHIGQWSKAHTHCVYKLKPYNPIPQPEDFNLPAEYTYTETPFGGIFYKYYGDRERIGWPKNKNL